MSDRLIKCLDKHVNLEMNVTIGSLVSCLDTCDAMNMIEALDLAQQDCDFTMDVIKMLIKSLRGDMEHDEMKEFLKELKELNKKITKDKFLKTVGDKIVNEVSDV